MAAPVRYLSGRQQQQKIGIEGSTQNEKVLEVVGRVGIGTTIFEPDSELEVRGDVIVSGIITAGSIEVSSGEVSFDDVNVSGVSTFTGAIDANGSLDVDGHTELDDVNVSGASTFTGAADFNGSLDVDGHTELDDVNVSGASTFTGAADFNGSLDVDGHTELDDVNVSGASTFTGAIDANGSLDVDGHTELDDVNVSGASTFTGAADFNGSLDVDGHTELDDLNVSGVTTTGGLLDINDGGQANTFKVEDLTDNRVIIAGTGGELEDDANLTFDGTQLVVGVNLNVSGVSTFTGAIDANGSLDVDGHTELDDVNVSGVSTFTGAIDANGSLDVDGHTELDDVNVSGASTFTGAIDANGSLDVDGHTELDDVNVSGASTFTGAADFNGDVDVDGHTELDDVNVSGVSTFTSTADFNGNVDIDGHTELDDVNVSGASTFTGAADFNADVDVDGHTELDDVNVSGASTFTGAADFNGDIDVDGHTELDNLNVSGVSTFVGVATFSTNDVYVAQRLFVGGVEVGGNTNTFAGINTFTDTTDNTLGDSNTGAVQINGGLGVDKNVSVGAGLSVGEGITVAGLSTFVGLSTFSNGDVYVAQRLFVGGLEVEGGAGENIFSGISTFTNQTDNVLGNSDTGATHFNGGIGIDKNATVGAGLSVVAGFEVGGVSTFTGNIDANGNLDVDGHTELDNVNASGISSATAFANFDYLQAPFGSTVTFTVTVASKDATHRYNGTGSGSAYLINGVQAPFLTLTPGRTYRFTNNNTGSHPFKFYLEADKTTEYTSGVSFQNSYTEITVSDETPTVLHYQCSAHGYMGNAVQTNSNVVNTNYAATLRDSLTVSGNINANGNIVGDNSTNITGIDGVTASTLSGTLQTAAQTNITSVGTLGSLTVSGDINANGNIVGDNSTNITGIAGVTATSLNITNKLTTTGIGISVANSGLRTAYIEGPEEIWIDPHPAGAGATSGSVRIRGDLYVDGTEFIVDVDKIELGDFNIGIASTVPTNALLDGAGLGIGAESIRKTITWNNATSALMSSENWNLASGKHYEINGTDVLTSTTLGSGVVNSSLTSVGTLTGLDVNGHTELDNVNVSGVSTFGGNIDLNAALDVSGNINANGNIVGDNSTNISGMNNVTADDFFGDLSGTVNTAAQPNITSVGTLTALNVSGISTFAGITTVTGDTLFSKQLNVTGVSTFGITQHTSIISSGNITSLSGNFIGANLELASADGGSAAGPEIKLHRNSGTPADADYLGQIKFAGESDTGVERNYAKITGKILDASNTNEDGILEFAHIKAGSQTITGRFRSDSLQLLNGTALSVDGDITATSDINANGNIVGDNSTNITGINQVTATTFSGNATSATTATNLAGGDTGDIPYQSSNGTTTFVDASGAANNQVLLWSGSAPVWANVSAGAGALSGISVQEEGSAVGTANSITVLNFVGDNVTATASGNNTAIITLSGTPTFSSLNVTGISTIPSVTGPTTFTGGDVNVGTAVTIDPTSGIISATAFYGSGENLTDLINQRIEGLQVLDEGTPVGTGFTFAGLDFVGDGVTVTSTGIGTTATITIPGFGPDAQQNLYAGTDAGAASDADTLRNIAFGCKSGCSLNEGDDNVFLGTSSGACVTSGSCNVFLGFDAGKFTTCGSSNIAIGPSAGYNSPGGDNNIFLGIGAGRQVSTGENNIFLGQNSGGQNASAPTTGIDNISLGRGSGNCLTDGADNIFLGKYAGYKTTGGDENVFLGKCAGQGNTTGCYNIFFGKFAAAQGTITGQSNIALGMCAGYKISTAFNNVFLGKDAGYNSTDGSKNIFIGRHAGCTNTTGDSNIAIGCGVQLPSATGNNQMAIGCGNNHWIAGDSSFNVTVSTASTFSSSGINVVGVVTATDFNSTSDARLKTNVQVIPNPLDKIVRIDGVSFNWIKDNKPSMGVIADNIQEVLPELVSDTDPKTVNYNGLIGLLIEVVKDQQTQINSLNERLSQLE